METQLRSTVSYFIVEINRFFYCVGIINRKTGHTSIIIGTYVKLHAKMTLVRLLYQL